MIDANQAIGIDPGSDFMKTSGRWKFRSIGSKVMMGLVLAVMFGSLDVAPVFARDDGERHDNGRYEKRDRGNDRDRHGRRGYRTTTVYRERAYVPPPVYYAPPPEPGIRIFLPSIFNRR
jgi:hypothetical protein